MCKGQGVGGVSVNDPKGISFFERSSLGWDGGVGLGTQSKVTDDFRRGNTLVAQWFGLCNSTHTFDSWLGSSDPTRRARHSCLKREAVSPQDISWGNPAQFTQSLNDGGGQWVHSCSRKETCSQERRRITEKKKKWFDLWRKSFEVIKR